MTIRYVLHPTITLYNYSTLPNAIAACKSGDIIRIHNGNNYAILSVNYYKDENSVVLSFDSTNSADVNDTLASVKSYDDLIIGNNKFVTRAATGNTTIAGTLDVNNDVIFDNNLTVNGKTTLNGDILMTGTNIDIGSAGSTVNIYGSTNYIVSNNLQITNSTITINQGSLPNSAGGCGIDIEEGGVTTGYIKVSNDRKSFVFKPPNGSESYISTEDVSGNSIVKGTLDVCGNLTVGDNKFNVNPSGNTIVNGTLDVSHNFTVGDGMIYMDSATGNAYFKGNIDVSGDITFDGKINMTYNDVSFKSATIKESLDVSGNTNLTGTLDVSGNTNLTGTLDVSGNSHLMRDLDISGCTTIDGSLNVTSNSIFYGDVQITGNNMIVSSKSVFAEQTIFSGDILTIGDSTLGNVIIDGILDINGNINMGVGDAELKINMDTIDISCNNNINIDSNINLFGILDISNNIIKTKNAYIRNNLDCSGNTNIDGSMNVTQVYIKENIDISGSIYVKDNMDISGSITVDGSLNVTNGSNFYGDINIASDNIIITSKTVFSEEIILTGNIIATGVSNFNDDTHIDGELTVNNISVNSNFNINEDGESVVYGDMDISGNAGIRFVNGGNTLLNYYNMMEQLITIHNSSNGGTSQDITIKLQRIGSMVTINIPDFSVNIGSNNINYIESTQINSSFRPSNIITLPFLILVDGNLRMSKIEIRTNGVMRFYRDVESTQWSSGLTNCGVYNYSSITYLV